MQLYPILLIVIVLAADGGVQVTNRDLGFTNWQVAALAWLPIMFLVALAWTVVRLCDRRMAYGGTARSITLADRTLRISRHLMLANHAIVVLVFGWLDVVRGALGDLILVDELVAIAPALLGALALWWVYFPIERRVREALLVRRLDMGKPIYPMPSRFQYVLLQFRTGMLILLVPIVLILGVAETIQTLAGRLADPALATIVTNGATIVAAVSVFVTAPAFMRMFLHVESMPPGPVRDELTAICNRHAVRVRDLLLWNTSGSMINAAVMGLFGRLRYVLVTDALIETMSIDQLKAVMAHEVGHVRRRHMPWLVIVFAAALFAAVWMVQAPLMALHAAGIQLPQGTGGAATIFIMLAQLSIALVAFGWACRRFERQADTFAVQHLSGFDRSDAEQDDLPRVQVEAVRAMHGALNVIAQLNAVDIRRPSWRHGSITWRQQYLESIVGTPLDALPIDRLIRYIKRGAIVILAVTLGAWLLM